MTTALSVNINKVALVRNTRHLGIPGVLRAATLCLQAGAQAGGDELPLAEGALLVALGRARHAQTHREPLPQGTTGRLDQRTQALRDIDLQR